MTCTHVTGCGYVVASKNEYSYGEGRVLLIIVLEVQCLKPSQCAFAKTSTQDCFLFDCLATVTATQVPTIGPRK